VRNISVVDRMAGKKEIKYRVVGDDGNGNRKYGRRKGCKGENKMSTFQ
jgi:hypothetical protein